MHDATQHARAADCVVQLKQGKIDHQKALETQFLQSEHAEQAIQRRDALHQAMLDDTPFLFLYGKRCAQIL